MNGRLNGKVALITGVGSGIGLEAAYLFALNGCRVVGCDINSDSGSAAVAKINEKVDKINGKPAVIFLKVDVSSEADIKSAVELAEKEFGKLNICFNNAGIV